MNNNKNQTIYNVIISGAGPVGLFLACELALAKCTVLILEKSDTPDSPLKQLPFGLRGLSTPTIEALDRRGLLDQLDVPKRLQNPFGKAPVPQATRQAGHFAGIPLMADLIDTSQWSYRLPSSTATSLMSEMAELETVLARRAEALGVTIRRGQGITNVAQTVDGVTAQTDAQTFHGQWLVGCDGARSAVRKAADMEFAGTEPEFTGYTTHATLADPEKLQPGRVTTPTGMYAQFQPGYLNLQDFDNGAFHNSDAPITLARVQEVLRRISNTDVTITALHVATTWTDRARQATSYRKGRILLAGDAAHIHSPLGGQGLNLGLGDAMNLGWKLAATIDGSAPDGLLDTYHIERHPVGAQVLDWSRAQVAIMRPDPHAKALHAIMRELMATRDGTTAIAGRVWGVTNQYDLGGAHPLIGRSAPNFAFDDGSSLAAAMHDGRALLLDFHGNPALAALSERYAGRIHYIARPAVDTCRLSALLVRPDGCVAWATDGAPDLPAIELALATWMRLTIAQ